MALTRRTLLTLGGGLAATTALAACGSNTGRTAAPSASPAGTPAATPSGTPDPDAGRPALSQWYHKYGEDGVEAAVKKWAAEYPGAEVNVNWVLADYEKTLAAALLTPTAPDVFEYANGPTLDMINAGQVADLTDTIGSSRGDFTPSVLDRLTYQDKVWAVPQTVDMQLLYYRKDLLEAKNLTAPTTLEQLTHVATTLAEGGDIGGFFAGNDGGIGVLGLLLMWAAGADEMNEARTEAAFNTGDFHAGIAQFKQLFDSPGMVKSASADWSDASPFINGEAALQWGGMWDLPKVIAAHGENFGVLPFPAIGGSGRQVVPFGAFSACVSAKSANVTAAKNFVKWLWIDAEDKQVEFSDAFGTHIPAKPKLFGQAKQVAEGPGADAAKFVTDHGRSNALFWTPASGEAYSTALSNVVKNGADAATEFGAAAEKVTAELARVA